MNMRNTLMILSLLVAAGCSKGGAKPEAFTEEDLLTNPAANFQKGLSALTPDRKTGAVDYTTAYNSFVASSNLGGGAKAAFNAGWSAEALGKTEAAESHYRTAYEADPGYEKALYSLARVLSEQGKHTDAVALYKGHAESHPEDYDVRNDYIAALVASGDYSIAVSEAQEILRHDPQNAAVYRNLSALYYAQNDYGMSQLTAEKALALNDGDPGVYNNMGVTYLLQGDEPAAIEKFKTAVKLDSKNFESNMNLGFTALNSGDYNLAHTSFVAATDTNPGSLDAKLGLAVALRGTKDYKAAGDLYDEIIDADSSNRAAYFNAATLHQNYTKDFAKALKYLQAYVDAHAGQVSPSDEVFALMQLVNEAKAEEDEKKRLEAEKKKAEEERKRRNKELLTEMATIISNTQTKLNANTHCLDAGSVEEVGMVLEQAQMVVDAEEADMAQDIKTLLDAYVPALDDAIAGCEPAAPEAPPEEAAPAEGEATDGEAAPDAEAAPEGEAPAEEGG